MVPASLFFLFFLCCQLTLVFPSHAWRRKDPRMRNRAGIDPPALREQCVLTHREGGKTNSKHLEKVKGRYEKLWSSSTQQFNQQTQPIHSVLVPAGGPASRSGPGLGDRDRRGSLCRSLGCGGRSCPGD